MIVRFSGLAGLDLTNHVTISIVLDVTGHHLVQGSEGGDVWVRFLVDDGDLEREMYCTDYWSVWITGLHLTIFHYTMKISRIFKIKYFYSHQIPEFVFSLCRY